MTIELVLSLGANAALLAAVWLQRRRYRRLAASELVLRQLSVEASRKLGARKAARLINATRISLVQQRQQGKRS